MSAQIVRIQEKADKQAGICFDQCSHLDCIAARQIALEVCRVCKEPIGFEQPFYSEAQAKVHKRCLESELAKKLQTEVELRFLTVEDAALLLRVEVGTIRNWVSQEKIPYRKVGANVLFLLEEVIAWTLPPSRKEKRARLEPVE
jgi:excisionase family DNA binding protein